MTIVTTTFEQPLDFDVEPDESLLTRDELIEKNVPLVGHLARQLGARLPAHVDKSDLISAGMTGLVQAADAFEVDRGIPFARYATSRIKGAMLDELRSSDWAPRGVRRKAREVEAAHSALAASLGRPPTTVEIADALGVSVEAVEANAEDVARSRVISLQGPTEVALADIVPARTPGPEQVVEHHEQLAYMLEALAELPQRLQDVVTQYFFQERPMADIGAEMGITESRVSQMCTDALSRIKEAMNRAMDPHMSSPLGDGCAARRKESYYAAVAARHTANLHDQNMSDRVKAASSF